MERGHGRRHQWKEVGKRKVAADDDDDVYRSVYCENRVGKCVSVCVCRGGSILKGALSFHSLFLCVFFISNYLILDKYCNNYFEF